MWFNSGQLVALKEERQDWESSTKVSQRKFRGTESGGKSCCITSQYVDNEISTCPLVDLKGNRQPSVTERKELLGKREKLCNSWQSIHLLEILKKIAETLCENICFVNWYLHCEFSSLMEKHAEEKTGSRQGRPWPLLRAVAAGDALPNLTAAFEVGSYEFWKLKKKKSSQILRTVYIKF